MRALKGTALMSLCIPSYLDSFEWAGVIRTSGSARKGTFYHIVDNGACEGQMADPSTLVQYARTMKADEVVSPDVLGDYEGTVEVNRKFFENPPLGFMQFKWMGVVQGADQDDLVRCAEFYAQNPAITTLGIPRIILSTLDQLNARIDFANRISAQFPGRFELHFLGADSRWPGEIRAAACYTQARSMDTSLPFNYALAGKFITERDATISRPKNYFSGVTVNHPDILEFNLHTAMGWANGRTTTPTS
jgi:hypothetical protein